MNGACGPLADDGVIRGVLATVDCQTRYYAQGGYEALTSGSPLFQTALTALLTIYVALVGYRLLFAQGSARLSDAPAIALKIGLILALTTSWATFQTLVFDLADRAPLEIAAVVSQPASAGGALTARPVDGLQALYDEFAETAAAYGKIAGPNAKGYSSPQAAAAETSAAAGGVLFLISAGTLSAAKLAIGVLTALGPLFIAAALIPVTRGLFAGWVRAVTASALVTLTTWVLLVLMLAVLDPWIQTLTAQRTGAALDPQTAISAACLVFVFAAGQAALVTGASVMAFGFQLPTLRNAAPAQAAPAASAAADDRLSPLPSRAERLALDLRRDQAMTTERGRALQTSAAAASAAQARSAPVTPGETSRLGDAYRRPAYAARRAGASR